MNASSCPGVLERTIYHRLCLTPTVSAFVIRRNAAEKGNSECYHFYMSVGTYKTVVCRGRVSRDACVCVWGWLVRSYSSKGSAVPVGERRSGVECTEWVNVGEWMWGQLGHLDCEEAGERERESKRKQEGWERGWKERGRVETDGVGENDGGSEEQQLSVVITGLVFSLQCLLIWLDTERAQAVQRFNPPSWTYDRN